MERPRWGCWLQSSVLKPAAHLILSSARVLRAGDLGARHASVGASRATNSATTALNLSVSSRNGQWPLSSNITTSA